MIILIENRAPFDRNSVSGFIGYFIIQALLLHCYYAGLMPCFSFFVGSCYYLQACCSDIIEQFQQIDPLIGQQKQQKSFEYDTKRRLIRIIKLHISIIEYGSRSQQ